MRHLSAYILFIFLFLLVPQIIYPADLQEGFSGIKWGTDISVLNNFSKIGGSDRVSYYLNPNERHSINNINIPHVVYGFYNQKLFAVFAVIENFEVYSQLKPQLIAKFGNPRIAMTARHKQTIYRWKHKDIKIKLKLRGTDDKMKLAFYYTPLSIKIDEDRVEELHEKSYRFLPMDKGREWGGVPLLEF